MCSQWWWPKMSFHVVRMKSFFTYVLDKMRIKIHLFAMMLIDSSVDLTPYCHDTHTLIGRYWKHICIHIQMSCPCCANEHVPWRQYLTFIAFFRVAWNHLALYVFCLEKMSSWGLNYVTYLRSQRTVSEGKRILI